MSISAPRLPAPRSDQRGDEIAIPFGIRRRSVSDARRVGARDQVAERRGAATEELLAEGRMRDVPTGLAKIIKGLSLSGIGHTIYAIACACDTLRQRELAGVTRARDNTKELRNAANATAGIESAPCAGMLPESAPAQVGIVIVHCQTAEKAA